MDRAPRGVDQAADVVDRLAVAGADRKATRIHAWQPERVDAGAGGEGVAAEVERIRLPRLHRLGDDPPNRRREQTRANPRQEAAARAIARQGVERLADPIALSH